MAEQLAHVGDPVSQTRLFSKIMYTLPHWARGVITSWELIPDDQKTIQVLTAKILNEETNQKLTPASSAGSVAYLSKSKSHFSSGRGGFSGRGNFNSRGTRTETSPPVDKRPRMRCDHCFNTTGRELNHLTVDCNKLRKKILDGAQAQTSRHSLTGQQTDSANTASHTTTAPLIDFGYIASLNDVSRPDASVWIADSGATKHATDQRSFLRNYVSVPTGSWLIKGIGGAVAMVRGYGDILFESKVGDTLLIGTMKMVLYAPDLGVNLISISTITAHPGAKVTYSGRNVSFSRNGFIDITGRRGDDDVYKLNLTVKPVETDHALVSKALGVPLSTWHSRLAHVNYKTIQKMERLQLVDGLAISDYDISCICEGCIYGKMCRSPFIESTKEEREVGELVVTDIQGPMQVPSLSLALYFLLIKDHGSGYRKSHFLKKKSEAADLILQFIALFQTETKKKVKCIRSDRGGEFDGKEFKRRLAELGVVQEFTVSRSPQQNGVAERDNRTVMEACRSSLYGRNHHVTSAFRLRLWAEAMAHAVYTLNRTLSRTGTVTPYQKYHGVKPSVSHLREFGMLCYSHVPDETRRKLDPKGEKCILLGYETTGYRVLVIATHRVKVTRDIIFDEVNDKRLALPQERLSHAALPFFPLASASETTGNTTNCSDLSIK